VGCEKWEVGTEGIGFANANKNPASHLTPRTSQLGAFVSDLSLKTVALLSSQPLRSDNCLSPGIIKPSPA
jgi:hypothetical protein